MIEEKSPFEIETTFNYASPIKRTVAGILDNVFLLFIVSFLFWYLIASRMHPKAYPPYPLNDDEVISYIYLPACTLSNWLYYSILESSPKQATFGKRLFRQKVVDETGERLTFMRATGRCFAKYLSSWMLFVGFLMMFWDKKRQGLHDKLAHTYVVASDK